MNRMNKLGILCFPASLTTLSSGNCILCMNECWSGLTNSKTEILGKGKYFDSYIFCWSKNNLKFEINATNYLPWMIKDCKRLDQTTKTVGRKSCAKKEILPLN